MTKVNMQHFREKVADNILTHDHFYVKLYDDEMSQYTVHMFNAKDGYITISKFLGKGDLEKLKNIQHFDVVYVNQLGEDQVTHRYRVEFCNIESFGTWEWQDIASISAKYDITDVFEV